MTKKGKYLLIVKDTKKSFSKAVEDQNFFESVKKSEF